MKPPTLKSLYALAFVIFYPFVAIATSQPKKTHFSVPAVIAFGDSILDTGNNNYINTAIKSNFKPYGRDFKGGIPTGRFSNGKIISDFFAEDVGVKELLPPYLDPNLKLQDLLTGVSFASSGSGYDPLTNRITSALSLEDQLKMFKDYIEKLKEAVGEERTAHILEKSIFILFMGTNDVSVTYFLSLFRRPWINIDDYTSTLVDQSSNFQQELYRLGARRIGVFSLLPIGCQPVQRTTYGGIERECAESVNEAAMMFNSKLSSKMMDLKEQLPDARLVYLDTYNEFLPFIQHPTQFGFEVGDKGCCGTLNVEVGFQCNSSQVQICKDASKYVFWDAFHLTEKTDYILCSQIIKKNYDNFF